MYFAYSNSQVNSTHHRSLPTRKSNFNPPKKAIRFFVVVLALTLVFSFGAFVQAYAGNADTAKMNSLSISNITAYTSSGVSHVPNKVVVDRGDTLWDIASKHVSKGQNIRTYIAQIKALNGLTSSSIKESDVLILP